MARNLRRTVLLAIVMAVPMTIWPAAAHAQGRGHARGPVVVVGGYYRSFLYDPFFGPFGWGPYGYPVGSPYYTDIANIKVHATPKDAEVFVDGYYAGIVDNFDGAFQQLNVRPGGHEFVLYREGFRPIHQTVYVQPGSSFTLRHTMVPLGAGETIEPRPAPAAPPPGMPVGPASRQRMPAGPGPSGY
jgi:hypothetical protein